MPVNQRKLEKELKKMSVSELKKLCKYNGLRVTRQNGGGSCNKKELMMKLMFGGAEPDHLTCNLSMPSKHGESQMDCDRLQTLIQSWGYKRTVENAIDGFWLKQQEAVQDLLRSKHDLKDRQAIIKNLIKETGQKWVGRARHNIAANSAAEVARGRHHGHD